MNRFLGCMLAAGAAIAMPSAVAADTGSPSLEQVYDAGRCIVDRDRRAALNLIAAQPLDADAVDLSGRSPELASRCAAGLEAANPLHLRGALAQALFFRDFGGFGLQPGRGVALLNMNLPVQDSPPGTETENLYRWADCVVRNDGPHTERLLESRIGSRTESAAIDGLRAFMAACMPQGEELRVSASQLRSVAAQMAYHSMYRYWTRDLMSTRGGD